MIPIIGWGFSILNWGGQRLSGDREINYDVKGILGIATGAGDLIDNKVVNTLSKWVGRALNAIEIGKYVYDWFYAHNYQMEEAIYNQFDHKIWSSSSRNIVDKKFEFAMNEMTSLMLEGKVGIAKAIDIFGKDAFYKDKTLGMITYQDDPLSGRKKFFKQDDYYLHMLDDSSSGVIADTENTIKAIRR